MTRRQQLDHERYMVHREDRLAKQRAYYQANRERILKHAKLRYLK